MATIELSAKLVNTSANQPLLDAEDVWIDKTPITTIISGKQENISDLSTIRANAALAASAVQPAAISDMETKTHASSTYQAKGNYLTASSVATVATSGKYSDLTGTPSIPTVNNATITIQKNGAAVGSFSTNTGTNTAVNITIPTSLSGFTNDSGFATQTWVNNQGYLKTDESGKIELAGYLKEADFIQKYAVLKVNVTSFSNTSLTGSYSLSIAGKSVDFDSGTLAIKSGSYTATVSGNVFTFSGNLLNSSTNKVSFVVTGTYSGTSLSFTSDSITAYAIPLKMGYLASSNESASTLVSKYVSTFSGINFDVTNSSDQNYLFLYIPKAMYTDFGMSSKTVQVQDRKSSINVVELEKQDITSTNYYVYRLDSAQKVGDYKWQTKLV